MKIRNVMVVVVAGIVAACSAAEPTVIPGLDATFVVEDVPSGTIALDDAVSRINSRYSPDAPRPPDFVDYGTVTCTRPGATCFKSGSAHSRTAWLLIWYDRGAGTMSGTFLVDPVTHEVVADNATEPF